MTATITATPADVATELRERYGILTATAWHSGGGIVLVHIDDDARAGYWQFGPNAGADGDLWGWDFMDDDDNLIETDEMPLKNTAPAWFVAEFIALRIQQAQG